MNELVRSVAVVLCERRVNAEDCIDDFEEDARAVVAAMREPTEAMLQFVLKAGWVSGQLRQAWRAMIDEALR